MISSQKDSFLKAYKEGKNCLEIKAKVLISELSGSESLIHFTKGELSWVSLSNGVFQKNVGDEMNLYMNADEFIYFDKNERLLYELMQTGSYELSGISPLRFKIGYAPATNLYIDDQKISFSRAIKGSTNYAHFWVNEANKVESIRD